MKKKLKIAIISKLWEETSPGSRGGTGSSLGYLVNGLVERGHHVTLFATGNSKTKAQKLVSARAKHFINDYSEVNEYDNIAQAFQMSNEFDIIHCAVEQKSLYFADLVKTPSIHSIRYGEFFDQELALLKKYRHLNYVTLSKAVKKLLPFLNWQSVIYNGVNVADFKNQTEQGKYLLFLARVTEQKGIDIAIKAAKKLNMQLLIAGKVSQSDDVWLKKNFYPLVDGKQIIYLGEVLGADKKKLLQEAYCLVQPNRVFEAFGNSILESMASGVPAVVYNKGALKELIDNNKTGFVVDNYSDLLKAIKKVKDLNKEDCLDRAKNLFSVGKMVDSYEDLYYKTIKKKKNF